MARGRLRHVTLTAAAPAPRFVACEQLGRRPSTGLVLAINEGERLPACSAMTLAKLFRTGGGNHASLYSRNPCRCGGGLFQRALRRCIGADCDNSKRRSSFCRTFDPCHFNCHELHDVLQFAVRELSNQVLHSKRAGAAPKHPSAGVGGGRFAHFQFRPKHYV
jgi:hypothetical protein